MIRLGTLKPKRPTRKSRSKPAAAIFSKSGITEIQDAVTAFSRLLLEDLDKATNEQWGLARDAVQRQPSVWTLILSVKRWARALADVCRSYAGKCARVHAVCRVKDPKEAVIGTMLQVLADHLQQNTLRDFVLDAGGQVGTE
jgi:hypothetical protein